MTPLAPPSVEDRSTGFYAPELDGLRCLAVATVMVTHFSPTVSRFADWGNIGVRLFFVLSGFLITTLLLRSRDQVDAGKTTRKAALDRFFTRRIMRLWPVYFLCLILAYAFHVSGTYTSIWWHALFATNHYVFANRDWPTLLSHFWTLAVEQQFYVIWPVVLLWIPLRAVPPLLLGVALAGPLSRAFLLFTGASTPEYVGVLLPCCLDFFGLGGAMAWALRHQRPGWLPAQMERGWVSLALVLWLVGGIVLKCNGRTLPGWAVYDGAIQAIGFAALIAFVIQHPENPFCRVLRHSWIVYLGRISYGIYIYHNFVHRIGPAILRRTIGQNYFESETAHVLYLTALTLVIAALSYHVIENPLRRLGRAGR